MKRSPGQCWSNGKGPAYRSPVHSVAQKMNGPLPAVLRVFPVYRFSRRFQRATQSDTANHIAETAVDKNRGNFMDASQILGGTQGFQKHQSDPDRFVPRRPYDLRTLPPARHRRLWATSAWNSASRSSDIVNPVPLALTDSGALPSTHRKPSIDPMS